jgi:hypothetical protein
MNDGKQPYGRRKASPWSWMTTQATKRHLLLPMFVLRVDRLLSEVSTKVSALRTGASARRFALCEISKVLPLACPALTFLSSSRPPQPTLADLPHRLWGLFPDQAGPLPSLFTDQDRQPWAPFVTPPHHPSQRPFFSQPHTTSESFVDETQSPQKEPFVNETADESAASDKVSVLATESGPVPRSGPFRYSRLADAG